jgi:hypothetical protein
LLITHNTRKRPSTGPRTTHGPQKACHSVPVQDGYVVVQPTYVWASASQYPLPVPIDEGDVATLAEALVERIQWPKAGSLYHP